MGSEMCIRDRCRREKSGTINDAKDEKVQRRSCLQDKTIDLFIRLNMRIKQTEVSPHAYDLSY